VKYPYLASLEVWAKR